MIFAFKLLLAVWIVEAIWFLIMLMREYRMPR